MEPIVCFVLAFESPANMTKVRLHMMTLLPDNGLSDDFTVAQLSDQKAFLMHHGWHAWLLVMVSRDG